MLAYLLLRGAQPWFVLGITGRAFLAKSVALAGGYGISVLVGVTILNRVIGTCEAPCVVGSRLDWSVRMYTALELAVRGGGARLPRLVDARGAARHALRLVVVLARLAEAA